MPPFGSRKLFSALILGVVLVPAAPAATVEFMSVRVVKTQETDGDEIRFSFSVDGKPDTTLPVKVMSKGGPPWLINRTVTYTKSVRVVMQEMDGAAGELIGANVLKTVAGIYESPFTLGGAHYVLTYRVVPTPVPSPPPTYVLQINWVFAQRTQESGGDELLFKYRADTSKTTTLSRTMYNRKVWEVKLEIPFKDKAIIALHEEDVAFDDFLGRREFTAKDAKLYWDTANFINSDGTHYSVQYRVVRR